MKPILLCLFLFISSYLSAQIIKGRVVDSKTGQSLPLANLMLTDQGSPLLIKYASSDTAGFFGFSSIPKGKYSLTITLMGYQKVEKILLINENSAEILELGHILIPEDINLLQEVTIMGGTANFSTKNGQIKIGIANNTFFKSASNLLDVLRKLPGLQVSQDGTIQMASRATPTVFVDGKPINMSNDEVLTYLNSLSPDMVESIEMINQPSSKYDGEYQGIIDIRLKRNLALGLRGIYNTRFQQNNYSLLDNNLSLVLKTPRFSYDFKLGHAYGSTYYQYYALQYLANSNALITDTRTITANQNFNAQAAVTYELKSGQNLEAFVRTNQVNRNAISGNQLLTQTPDLDYTLNLVKSDNDARPKQRNYAGGLNYNAQFKNSELHIISTLAQIDNRQTEDIQNRNIFKNELVNYWKTNSRNNILIRTLQADYIQKTGKGKLEFGGKYAYNSTQNNLRYDTLANAVFNLDPKRSNQFSYHEHIAAGYLFYTGQLDKISYSLGLRTEHTVTVANSVTTGILTERRYLKWLPSLNLTYRINNSEQLSFSYSKRLTRPTFAALNPFRFYYSPRHYWIGNPYLQPATTNLFALSYSRKSLNISLNAGRETDVLARYPEYNPETNELIFLGRNLPYRNFANLQVSSPITVTKWWRMNNNVSFNYNKELTPYFGQTYQIPVYDYKINGSQVFTLKDWLIDVSYTYESKSGNGLYIFSPIYGVDFGLQKTWLKNKLNTKMTLYDAFDNIKRRLIFREKHIINNDMYHYNAARRLVFSLTYNFGSSTYKAKENKKNEDENRAN
ncbi:TonB-dependent receptor [Pedobacter sp. HDW13]|uniref:TonB-dependent receptor domain-containing protein n=1 Tax=Pedobacter sp. HDW13 TaxID=2714940 RepID=UPI001409E43D|nr:TonB-dependent receptor [Pedobacter sp. HDW13]QIL39715.1 TonB-dependent receptor [Pedobacter sp. HDW13]